MTVNELIQSLETFPPDAEVKVWDPWNASNFGTPAAVETMFQDAEGDLWPELVDAEEADAEIAEDDEPHVPEACVTIKLGQQ